MPNAAAGFVSSGKQQPCHVSQNEPGHCMNAINEGGSQEHMLD
jgi:hypothetical protein